MKLNKCLWCHNKAALQRTVECRRAELPCLDLQLSNGVKKDPINIKAGTMLDSWRVALIGVPESIARESHASARMSIEFLIAGSVSTSICLSFSL
jgi:hypothetical protein